MALLNDGDISAIQQPFPQLAGIMKKYAQENNLEAKIEELPWRVNKSFQLVQSRLFNEGYLCASIDAVTNRGVLLSSDEIFQAALTHEYLLHTMGPPRSTMYLLYLDSLEELEKSRKKGFRDTNAVRAEKFVRENLQELEEIEHAVRDIMWCDEQTEPVEIMAREKEGYDFLQVLLDDPVLNENLVQKIYGNGESVMDIICGPYQTKWYNFAWIFFWTDDKNKATNHRLGYKADLQALGLVDAPVEV